MIVSKITGGLGNQMFQYAMGKAVALHLKTGLKLDNSYYTNQDLRKFELAAFKLFIDFASEKEKLSFSTNHQKSIIKKIADKLEKTVFKRKIYSESNFSYDKMVFETSKNTYFDGYWQSEKYFKKYGDEIRDDFTFKAMPDGLNLQMLKTIENVNAVSLHIRRGDYFGNKQVNQVHGLCEMDYYLDAVKYIESKVADPVFLIFSDDINWVKENLHVDRKTHYIDFNTADNSFEDMRLMSFCKHNIIANSTFSWWGAWLNRHEQKIVIAPKRWFKVDTKDTKDLIPEAWHRL